MMMMWFCHGGNEGTPSSTTCMELRVAYLLIVAPIVVIVTVAGGARAATRLPTSAAFCGSIFSHSLHLVRLHGRHGLYISVRLSVV